MFEVLNELAVGRTVRVKDGALEHHLWRQQRILFGESEMRAEESTYTIIHQPCSVHMAALLSLLYAHTAVVSAVVRDHKHDLPFQDIAVDKPAANPRNVLVRLHLLELATQ